MPPRANRGSVRVLLLLFAGLAAVAAGLAALALSRTEPEYPSFDVTVHDESASAGGYSLFAPTVDDLGYELETPNEVYLLDMRGKIAHSWQVLRSVQQVKLKRNGNLVYTTRDRSFSERAGIREIDPFGNVVWFHKIPIDHDFELLASGNVLAHYVEDVEAPAIGPGPIRCPRIAEITPGHEVVWEWRSEEHVEELERLLGIPFPLDRQDEKLHDWAHNNAAHVIKENDAAAVDPRFRPGNILFSYANLNTIGVIDRESGAIVWAWGPGELDGQHDPQMLPNGRLLLFDNGTEREYSRIIELDPLTLEITWQYDDREAPRPRFFSRYISGVQRLDNGNLFVCQGSDSRRPPAGWRERLDRRLTRRPIIESRLFEIDRAGRIVWDCSLTFSGENMHGVYQAERYSDAYVVSLMQRLDEMDMDTRRLESLPYAR